MNKKQIINYIKNKLEQLKKTRLICQKDGLKELCDIYKGEIIALERLLEEIENGEN